MLKKKFQRIKSLSSRNVNWIAADGLHMLYCCILYISVAEGHFDSKSIGLRAQKKLMGKFASKKIAKVFIDDTSGRLLDNLHKCTKMYFDKKKAEKAMKHLIKTVIKIGILYRNDQLSGEEIRIAEDFKRKFRTVAMTVISFYEVDFTFDKGFLNKSLTECSVLLKKLVERHLQDKSLTRIDNVFSVFGDTDFLESMFQPRSQYRDYLAKIVQDLNSLLEQGVL